MFVFMNARGEYLKLEFHGEEVDEVGSYYSFEWVADLHSATVTSEIPHAADLWMGNPPHVAVVARVPAEAVETRTVTLYSAAPRDKNTLDAKLDAAILVGKVGAL